MGKMVDWMMKFYSVVSDARDESERENLLAEHDDIKAARQIMTNREMEIMRRLRELDGLPERRAQHQESAGRRDFNDRHPAVAETLRIVRTADPLLPFGSNEVKPIPESKVTP